jgi:A/G-specific adenine glycosylase
MHHNKPIGSEIVNNSSYKPFVQGLLNWNKHQNKRQMPWKGEKDPYKIWLSEIILQQTRVEQGWGYYKRFIETFPTVKKLADAPEKEIFKLWEGLGYYSRCKNLIASAKFISNNLKGSFPKDYETILSLKGVGSYTAAAISSFAYNTPYAVLDGNVFRVLSRIFDVETPIDSLPGKKLFSSLAQTILPINKPGEYNQAIMDFGATVCKPVPECAICFFKKKCCAFLQGKQQLLPVKSKRISIKERWFNYMVIKYQDKYAIQKRINKDIWENLFEFLLIETGRKTSFKKLLLPFEKAYGIKSSAYMLKKPVDFKQRLSHQIIHFQFIEAQINKKIALPENMIWVNAPELKKYPFPKTLQHYITSNVS